MQIFKKLFFAVLLGTIVTTASAGSILLDVTHDYGSGQFDPEGTDIVTVSDSSSGRFNDSFNLSGTTGTIERIELTLTFSGAGPDCPFGFCGFGEIWEVRAQGSNSSASNDDTFNMLDDSLSSQTLTYSAATDGGLIDTFATSLSNNLFEFWFSESSIGADSFILDSVQMQAFGTPVPLPTALPLLGMGMLGLSFFRRQQKVTNA